MKSVNYTYNEAYARNVTVALVNDGNSDTKGTLSFNLIERMYGAFVNISVHIPKTYEESDNDFTKVIMTKYVDVKKIINGDRDNFLVSLILGSILKQSNIVLKFPLEKVS